MATSDYMEPREDFSWSGGGMMKSKLLHLFNRYSGMKLQGNNGSFVGANPDGNDGMQFIYVENIGKIWFKANNPSKLNKEKKFKFDHIEWTESTAGRDGVNISSIDQINKIFSGGSSDTSTGNTPGRDSQNLTSNGYKISNGKPPEAIRKKLKGGANSAWDSATNKLWSRDTDGKWWVQNNVDAQGNKIKKPKPKPDEPAGTDSSSSSSSSDSDSSTDKPKKSKKPKPADSTDTNTPDSTSTASTIKPKNKDKKSNARQELHNSQFAGDDADDSSKLALISTIKLSDKAGEIKEHGKPGGKGYYLEVNIGGTWMSDPATVNNYLTSFKTNNAASYDAAVKKQELNAAWVTAAKNVLADSSGDGTVSAAEQKLFSKVAGENDWLSKNEARRIFNRGPGTTPAQKAEYELAVARGGGVAYFKDGGSYRRIADADNNGTLSVQEIRAYNAVDTNHDGVIDKTEAQNELNNSSGNNAANARRDAIANRFLNSSADPTAGPRQDPSSTPSWNRPIAPTASQQSGASSSGQVAAYQQSLRVFDRVDTNHDGIIDKTEAQNELKKKNNNGTAADKRDNALARSVLNGGIATRPTAPIPAATPPASNSTPAVTLPSQSVASDPIDNNPDNVSGKGSYDAGTNTYYDAITGNPTVGTPPITNNNNSQGSSVTPPVVPTPALTTPSVPASAPAPVLTPRQQAINVIDTNNNDKISKKEAAVVLNNPADVNRSGGVGKAEQKAFNAIDKNNDGRIGKKEARRELRDQIAANPRQEILQTEIANQYLAAAKATGGNIKSNASPSPAQVPNTKHKGKK